MFAIVLTVRDIEDFREGVIWQTINRIYLIIRVDHDVAAELIQVVVYIKFHIKTSRWI